MHGAGGLAREIVETLIHLQADAPSQPEVVVIPPTVYISQVAKMLDGSNITWGAQNVSAHEEGAYTGEIAASMLQEFGCRYVIVGHSERRRLFVEDDVVVAMKFAQVQRYQMIPILCVGETREERDSGKTTQVIERQLTAILELEQGVAGFANAVIAYEPVWAIGTGLSATPDQAQAQHAEIRTWLAKHDESIARDITILYGGSVKASNAQDLFKGEDIDGGLIGGASLDAHSFMEITRCFN